MNETKVYITKANILDNDEIYETLYKKVSPVRQARADRYMFRKDKNLCIGAQILLSFTLANEGIYDYALEYGDNGKPYLKDNDKVFFNLSHSGDTVMCVISDAQVGCDVEKCGEFDIRVAKKFFSDIEYAQLQRCENDSDKKDVFFRIWTLKESFMKVTGQGMTLKSDSFSVDISSGSPEVIQSLNSRKYHFEEFEFDDGYKYAVCCEKPHPCVVRFVELDKLQ